MSIDAERLRAGLAARPPRAMRLPGFRPAAVLVPLVDRGADDAQLILTLRHDGLPTHAGQISFPGGKRNDDDADAESTALRETEEEIGVARTLPLPLGRLDDVPTPTLFMITPVVARLRGPVALVPNPREVAAVLEVPLAALRDPANYNEAGRRSFLGIEYVMHEYQHGPHRIWGATARIIYQLLAVLDQAPSSSKK